MDLNDVVCKFHIEFDNEINEDNFVVRIIWKDDPNTRFTNQYQFMIKDLTCHVGWPLSATHPNSLYLIVPLYLLIPGIVSQYLSQMRREHICI